VAYVDGATILRAVRQRLTEGLFPNVRQPAPGAYEPGAHEAQSERERSMRAVVVPRVEARITSIEKHPAAPSWGGDKYLMQVGVEVRVVRHFALHESVSVETREDMRGAAARDADIVRQALTWPGALVEDAAGTPTGLVSRCLTHDSSEVGEIETTSGDMNGTLTTTHELEGVVLVTQQIFPVDTAPIIQTSPTIEVLP
jgi:hypothetical protein